MTAASQPDRQPTFLVISTYEKGQPFLRELSRLGARVVFLTVDKLRDADWPHEALAEFHTMPQQMTVEQILHTVMWMGRTRHFDRVVALDEFDMETVAAIREHMRIPGMGLTTTHYFRDKLAMRVKASRLRIPGLFVPEFSPVFNYEDIRHFLENTPGPWLLKPRADASAIGIRKIQQPDEIWPMLEELGDRQSYFVLERFVPGEIYHVDSITSDREVLYAAVHKYGKPPMQVMHEGGIFTTRTLDRESEEAVALTAVNREFLPAIGMVRGVTHTEFIRAHADGKYYFLETAARVGGAFIADVMEHASNLNPWVEWARIEWAAYRGQPYRLPELRSDYAGSVLCLARQQEPDTSAYDAPEIAYRMKKHHHAGLIVRSTDPERVRTLLEEYAVRFAQDFVAQMPVPDRPTA
jgi:biotin carboxylase